MLNILKMDIKRLFRSTSLYVMLGIFMFIVCVTIYSDHISYNHNIERQNEVTYTDDDYSDDMNETDGIGGYDYDLDKNLTFAEYLESVYTGCNLAFLIMMFIILFITTEYQTGYIKNIANIPRYRWYNVISKTITGIVTTIVFNILGAISIFVAVSCIFKVNDVGSFATAFKVMGLQLLIEAAIIALAVFIANAIRNKAFSVTISVIISAGMVTYPICFLLGKIFDKKVNSIYYKTLIIQMSRVTANATQKVITQASVIAIVYLVVCTLLSCIIMQKRDV